MDTVSLETEARFEQEPTADISTLDYAQLNEARRLRWIQMRITDQVELTTNELIRPTLLPEINILDRFLGLALYRARKDGQDKATLADINEMQKHLKIINSS